MKRSVLLLVALAGVASCGSTTDARVQAREQATMEVCNKAMGCGSIGPGQTYETMDSCEVQWRGMFEAKWPPTCVVNPTALSQCLASIDAVACGSGLDVLVALGKCDGTTVCVNADAAAAQ
jgi:hypothetical protein